MRQEHYSPFHNGILPSNAIADGNIFFRDKDLLKLDREAMRQLRGREISMIFQEPMTSLNLCSP